MDISPSDNPMTPEQVVESLLTVADADKPLEEALTPEVLDQIWEKTGVAPVLADLCNADYDELPALPLLLAQRHFDEMEAPLIAFLKSTIQSWRDGEEIAGIGPVLAMYLLSEFKSPELLPILLEIMRLPVPGPEDIFGESVTEDLSEMLAGLVDDPNLLDDLIRDDSIYQFCRWEAAHVYCFLVRDKKLSRDEACARLVELLDRAVHQSDGDAADGLFCTLRLLANEASFPSLRKAFDSGLVDQTFCRVDDIEVAPDAGSNARDGELARLPPSGIQNAFQTAKDWGIWGSNWEDEVDVEEMDFGGPLATSDLSFLDDETEVSSFDEPATIRNEGFKVGRNELCPCGSGRKYKKCCGRRE